MRLEKIGLKYLILVWLLCVGRHIQPWSPDNEKRISLFAYRKFVSIGV